MSAVEAASLAARRFADSGTFLDGVAKSAASAVSIMESALSEAVRGLSPSEVDEVLANLDDDLGAVLAVLAARGDAEAA